MAENNERHYKEYPHVKKSIVDQAFGFFDAYTNELNGGNPEDTGAMLRLLLLLNNADSVVFDLLDELNRIGREINKPGHRDNCPLKSGLHYTNVIANDNKDLVSITERIDLETGKYKDIELHNLDSKETDMRMLIADADTMPQTYYLRDVFSEVVGRIDKCKKDGTMFRFRAVYTPVTNVCATPQTQPRDRTAGQIYRAKAS